MGQLQEGVLLALDQDDRQAFAQQLAGRDLEQALSRLRRIAALLTEEQELDGLTAAAAVALDAAVCRQIVKALDLDNADLAPVHGLAAWAARADYRLPLELFTVNYDLLLETALERLRVAYFDGFIGTLRARFHTELVEGMPGTARESVPGFFVRLWKLHGSVNWAWEEGQQIVRLGRPVTEGSVAAIYPSDTKYEESRRVPFVILQDRLRRALLQPETLMLISGYSFSDAHLNELIFDAATRRERSELVAFCYAEIPEALADRASSTPNLQAVTGREAILGGVRANWVAPQDPPPDLWEDGQLALRDFRHLAAYLARSATREPERDPLLRELMERVVSADRQRVSDGDADG
ncbi:MAG: SIR2 family protein [Actinobacteria bacterium]|nr:SIR2 family protein [Actinomycetota bacterium]